MNENIGGWLTKRAFLDPHMEAFIDVASGRRFTFQESNKRANRIANVAGKLGLKKGDRVGFKTLEDDRKVRYFKSNGEVVDI